MAGRARQKAAGYRAPITDASRARYREKCRRRRALQRALPVERYRDVEIFERDGWRCQLCRRKVNPKYMAPHPKSASIDHIVPVSCGGGDIRSNVQLAHRDCNTRKQTGGMDQLRLIG